MTVFAMSIGSLLMGGVAGLIMIGTLVVVHEFGHFIVAKMFKVGVPVFSVGMGPRAFGFHWKGTDYRVSWLPVGGYVQLAGADPFGEEDAEAMVDPDEDFMQKPVWQRLLVMLAGPAANLILPFVLFTAVLMGGEPQAANIVGTVMPGTPAAEAGIEVGDEIVAVAGEPVELFLDVNQALEAHADDASIPIRVLRDGQEKSLTLGDDAVQFTSDGYVDLEKTGFWAVRRSTRLGVDDPASPAFAAGLRTGDQITRVDGKGVETWDELEDALQPVDQSHEITYRRVNQDGDVRKTATLEPSADWTPRDPATGPFGIVHAELFVGNLNTESPALAAGVKANDRMLSVDGRPVRAWSDILGYVGSTMGPDGVPRELTLEVVRDGEVLSMVFAPDRTREIVRGEPRWRPVMGVRQYPDSYVDAITVKKYYGMFEAVPRAVEEGTAVFGHTMTVLGNLFTLKLKPSESVGGPIEIFRIASESASRGIFFYVRTIGMISFSLGIINLLPVPVLDGGQIVFYTVEGIRGRPLSLELRERVQMIGVLGLVALMLMVAVMDVNRWLTSVMGG